MIEMSRSHIGDDRGLKPLESLKIIQLFKSNSSRYAGVCRIRLRPTSKNPNYLIGHIGLKKLQILSREKDGSLITYVEGRPRKDWISFGSSKFGYQSPPFELTPRGWRKVLVGSKGQIDRMLSAFEKAGLDFKIVSAGEARFSSESMLSSLTPSQRRTLEEAYMKGYFDVPRRIDSAELARSLDLSKSTISEHLRKSEKTILDQVFAE